MGLFSKETVTCSRCGKQFQTRLGDTVCSECAKKEEQLAASVHGYIQYAKIARMHPYSIEQMLAINVYREEILKKYCYAESISRGELKKAADHYSSLTDAQAQDILHRVANASMEVTTGAAYNTEFFAPLSYDGVIVDGEDVFAVGIVGDTHFSVNGHEAILCVLFTNDPYLPAFSMLYLGKLGFFELTRSKRGRESVQALFTYLCPNLTYPVDDIKALKKQLKKDGGVKGNIPMDIMLSRISDACLEAGIFKAKTLTAQLPPITTILLDQYGYITEDEIAQIMRLDKMFPRNFWEKQMKKIN